MGTSLLVQPELRWSVDYRTDYIAPPLGLAYLAAVLLQNGRQTAILDLPMARLGHEDVLARIRKDQPDWVGLTCTTMNFPRTEALARDIKQRFPDLPIVVGGPHVTYTAATLLRDPQSPFDVVVRGEAEDVIADLDLALTGADWRERAARVPGVCLRIDGQVSLSPRTSLIADLNSLPRPARHLLPMERYRRYQPHTPVITSRGCPFTCHFCSAGQMQGSKFRFRSPDNILDEVEEIVDTYGFEVIHFSDDTFSYHRSRVLEICDRFLQRGITARWLCETRAETLTEAMLRRMKEAGCFLVTMGVESGCQKLNERMGRRSHIGHIRQVVDWCHRVGIESRTGFMIGLAGETRDTLDRCLEFALEIRPDHIAYSIMTPYPGTRIAEDPGAFDIEIVGRDFSEYRHDKANIRLPGLEPVDLEREWMRLVAETYVRKEEETVFVPTPKPMCQDCRHDAICFPG
ncbi:MAG: cobalamin-dependent protein [Magnetococcales bacterium]|nr:cobalamin-dependent protein [Magnetococcales bacterium]